MEELQEFERYLAHLGEGLGHACWRRPKTEPLLRVVPTQN